MIAGKFVRLLALIMFSLVAVSACGGPAPVSPTAPVADVTTGAATSAAPATVIAEAPATTAPTVIPSPTTVATTTTSPTMAATTTRSPTIAPTGIPTPTIAASPTAVSATQVLEAKWFVDSDGNAVPDFVETDLGYDPKANDCASKQCGPGAAGAELLLKERNTLILLDASGSMAARISGVTKIDAAKGAIKRYVSVVSNALNLGFMVYGHKGNNTEAGKAESCAGIDLLAPIGQVKRETIVGLLDQFQPTGWTPIAAALTKAGEAFLGKEGATNRIVLVSDGIETCGGDPVAVAQQLHSQGFNVQIDVVGFDIKEDSPDAQQLRQIAEVTGGSYYDAKRAADLDNYFKQQGQALGQTVDALLCESRNSFNGQVCDQNFVNKVNDYISKQAQDLDYFSSKAQAYRQIEAQIQAKLEERKKERDAAQVRVEQLQQQYNELNEQMRRALEEQYGK